MYREPNAVHNAQGSVLPTVGFMIHCSGTRLDLWLWRGACLEDGGIADIIAGIMSKPDGLGGEGRGGWEGGIPAPAHRCPELEFPCLLPTALPGPEPVAAALPLRMFAVRRC